MQQQQAAARGRAAPMQGGAPQMQMPPQQGAARGAPMGAGRGAPAGAGKLYYNDIML